MDSMTKKFRKIKKRNPKNKRINKRMVKVSMNNLKTFKAKNNNNQIKIKIKQRKFEN